MGIRCKTGAITVAVILINISGRQATFRKMANGKAPEKRKARRPAPTNKEMLSVEKQIVSKWPFPASSCLLISAVFFNLYNPFNHESF